MRTGKYSFTKKALILCDYFFKYYYGGVSTETPAIYGPGRARLYTVINTGNTR